MRKARIKLIAHGTGVYFTMTQDGNKIGAAWQDVLDYGLSGLKKYPTMYRLTAGAVMV